MRKSSVEFLIQLLSEHFRISDMEENVVLREAFDDLCAIKVIDQEWIDEAINALRKGNKVLAIKTIRHGAGLNLEQAVYVCDHLLLSLKQKELLNYPNNDGETRRSKVGTLSPEAERVYTEMLDHVYSLTE